jgi:hypothetical protein
MATSLATRIARYNCPNIASMYVAGAGQPRGGFNCDAGIESSRVVGSACSCLAGEDSDGSGDARVVSAVRNKPPILVGMPEKVVNNSYAL